MTRPWLPASETANATPAFRLSLLGAGDADALYGLHRDIVASLSRKEFMYAHGRAFFRRLTGTGGRVVGAFVGGTLIGYAALRLPIAGRAGHASRLRHLDIDAREIVEGAGGGILPEFRSRGLFSRLIAARTGAARRLGLAFHTSVVSPANRHAFVTLLEQGFIAAGRLLDDDGENYLVLRVLRGHWRMPPSRLGATLADTAGNMGYLRQGLCGVLHGRGDALHIRYGRLGLPPAKMRVRTSL